MPALLGKARVRMQLPFAAGDASEPEPDVAMVSAATPRQRHPDTALLVIEVADTSLSVDLGRKARIYAYSGVPEYWVIDLTEALAYVHADPGPHGYGAVDRVAAGAGIEAAGLGVTVRLGDLLAT